MSAALLEPILRTGMQTLKISVKSTDTKIDHLAKYLIYRPKKESAKHSSIYLGAQILRRPLAKKQSKLPVNYITIDQCGRKQLKPNINTAPSLHQLVAKLSGKEKESVQMPYASLYLSKSKDPIKKKENVKYSSFTALDIEKTEQDFNQSVKKKAALFAKWAKLESKISSEEVVSNNIPKISSKEIEELEDFMKAMENPHNHEQLDQIVERGNIYFAIQFLVKDLIIQAESQARDVLRIIKERKKTIDALGDLSGAFVLAKGDIDYSKDGHMREMIDRAVEAGVPIAPGKYDFTQSERDDLMKIIDSKKSSIESFNQTEMVTLQEKQSRFNSLQEMLTHLMKQLEHVIRTIVGNVRPG